MFYFINPSSDETLMGVLAGKVFFFFLNPNAAQHLPTSAANNPITILKGHTVSIFLFGKNLCATLLPI